MVMHDINSKQQKVILLIHPMLSAAEGMKTFIADYLGGEYRYLIPDLSAHGDSAGDTYQSAALEAKAIHDYLQNRNLLEIQLGFGASLGGVVLFELLKYTDLHFEHIFFEGVSFYEHAAMQNFVLRKAFIGKHRKAVANPQLAVKKMGEIYGEKAAGFMAKHFIAMNEDSIKNIVYDCTYVNLPELSEAVQKKCIFAFGEKDSDLKQARKIQPAKYPHAELKIWPGYDHCVKMTADSQNYTDMLKTFL